MNGKTLYSTNSKEDAEINLQKIEKESNGFIYGLEIVEQPKGKQPTQTKENTTSIESVLDNYNKNDRYISSGDVGYIAKDDLGNTTDIFNDIKKAENQVELWQETNPNDGWRVEKVNKLKEERLQLEKKTSLPNSNKTNSIRKIASKFSDLQWVIDRFTY